jgi:hypothetical protein
MVVVMHSPTYRGNQILESVVVEVESFRLVLMSGDVNGTLASPLQKTEFLMILDDLR